MRYETLVRYGFEIFVVLRLFAECIIFSSERFSPGPYYLWNLIDILSLQHSVMPWKMNLGLAYFCVYICIYEENVENFGLGTITMSGGLDYSCMRNQNHQCVTVAVACGQRSYYMTLCRTEDE